MAPQHIPGISNIENGIRYIRLELPTECKSLPYAMTLNGVHMRLKHNGQTRVCNLCLENDHIMRNCPKYVCRECNSQGHWEAKCPQVRCFKCNDLGHKSFNCPQAGDDNNDHHGNGDPATGRNTISPPKHANVQHTDQPKDEAMDQLSQTKGSAIETNETKKKQNENIKTTQRMNKDPPNQLKRILRIQKQLEETKRLKPLTPPVTKQRQMNQPWNYLNI
ncbi:putative zinc finger CCHC domain-containing protein 10-like [Apostichopus japonicus]|uniref:Putative zinc finger CCHC domain-containing protein 10-like n=1 Tax=Stichopus japonicus TaxID=307972 RepID=A0A2G8JES2_STIJA|nr:putative zinc finger CCHC domain-containing protein 10-like [Apostichopus japonicus]